eukprot:15435826-Alexandrium_andersonii.AAC.1
MYRLKLAPLSGPIVAMGLVSRGGVAAALHCSAFPDELSWSHCFADLGGSGLGSTFVRCAKRVGRVEQ